MKVSDTKDPGGKKFGRRACEQRREQVDALRAKAKLRVVEIDGVRRRVPVILCPPAAECQPFDSKSLPMGGKDQ